jgi:hypothetical protein
VEGTVTTEANAAARQMEEELVAAPEHWTLDKKIPIAIIFALLVQGGGLAWWAATIEGRLSMAERSIVKLDGSQIEQRADRDRMIRLEERIISMVEEQRRMNGKLEVLLDERRPRPK